jgi:hypothetical protein
LSFLILKHDDDDFYMTELNTYFFFQRVL